MCYCVSCVRHSQCSNYDRAIGLGLKRSRSHVTNSDMFVTGPIISSVMLNTDQGLFCKYMHVFCHNLPLNVFKTKTSVTYCDGNNLPTMSSIRGPGDAQVTPTKKCLPESHLPFVYVISGKVIIGFDCTASKSKAKLDPQANFPRWRHPTCTQTLGGKHTR